MQPESAIEKKVLIITYYWPPFGGSGVQRWLKFVKYLPAAGWTPYVFTPENPAFGLRDESLLRDVPREAEVIHFPIWEPYGVFSRITGRGRDKKAGSVLDARKGFLQKVALWVRANLIIPDPRRFWIRPSSAFLSEFLLDNAIRTIVTTGPPHSVHLIGLRLKRKNPSLRWIADFRDPWSEWGFLDSLGTSRLAKRRHRKLEARVLRGADVLVTITPFYQKQFMQLSGRRVNLVTNGYDEEDFINFQVERQDAFIIRHVGTVNERCDPRAFMGAVAGLCTERPDIREKLKVEFVGVVQHAFRSEVERDPLLSSITNFVAPVYHERLLQIYRTSAVHLLVLAGYKDAEGYLPGKLFEYMATGLPIIGIGPADSDAGKVLRETGCGVMIEATDKEEIANTITTHFDRWENDNPAAPASAVIGKYSRRNLAAVVAHLFR